jgi:uncharacterized membrane protein YqaE (UPF0057 family)
MDNGREILKQILLIIAGITLPPLAGWVFGAWGAIILLTTALFILAYYVSKYRG